MTLKEMKIKTFSLIEEYYPEQSGLAEDEDVLNKINGVINSIQLELMRIKKIPSSTEITIELEDEKTIDLKEHIKDLYQLKSISFEEDIDYENPIENIIILPEDYKGTFTVYYYKYPKLVSEIFKDDETREAEDNTYVFELDDDVLGVMPYGISADLLKMDMISGYGRYFYERYQELKSMLDPRRTSGQVKIVGGIDV